MTTSTGSRVPPGVIYLVHSSWPFRHARHYTGWAAHLNARLAEHEAGRGARLLQVVTQAGIGWTLARTSEGTRERGRQLKCQGGASRRHPLRWAEQRRSR